MTRREPEWNDEERANVLALLDYESQLCRCGGYLPETTDPDNDGRYKAGEPVRCYRCHAVHVKQDQVHRDSVRKPSSALVVWPVTLG